MKLSHINKKLLQTGLSHLGKKLYEQPFNLDEYQCTNIIIFNERTGNIVIGHKQIKKLEQSGYTKVQCVVVDLDEHQEKALTVVLNKVNGNVNMPFLRELMYNLDKDSFR